MCERNQFALYIYPNELKLLQMFLFRYFIEGMLLQNINTRIDREKVSYGEFLVFTGVWIMMAKIKGPSTRYFWSTIKWSTGGRTIPSQ